MNNKNRKKNIYMSRNAMLNASESQRKRTKENGTKTQREIEKMGNDKENEDDGNINNR